MLDGYVWASGADILRAAQKDREYVSELRKHIEGALKSSLPPRMWSNTVSVMLEIASSMYYYLVTSIAGKQTLGEEYCDVFEVDSASNGRHAPPLFSTASLMIFHAAGKLAVKTLLKALPRSYGLSARDDALNALISWIQRAHLALFYLTGKYYELPKRLSGIRYLRIAAVKRLVPRYQLLGVLLSVQVVLSAVFQLWSMIPGSNHRRNSRSSQKPIFERVPSEEDEATVSMEQVDPKAEEKKTCPLCMSPLKDPALTECGHVFCWDCISEWCSDQDICPLCRQNIHLHSLLCLYNY
mmetsp:Transcript_1359/g.2114  ORF Transcript_1359/g.2114 Transcript_1359/m.2114 type:complete len:297 (+) Transcript_1359:74-964(+)